jgi:hypothetical protein
MANNVSAYKTKSYQEQKRSYQPKLLSYKKIAYVTEHQLKNENNFVLLIPEETTWRHCGNDIADGDPIENGWVAYESADYQNYDRSPQRVNTFRQRSPTPPYRQRIPSPRDLPLPLEDQDYLVVTTMIHFIGFTNTRRNNMETLWK